jgi:hypothetical protein
MRVDWVAVTGVASVAASITAVASIVLAYKGVRVSRDSSAIDRRNYLDGIFVKWLNSVDALDHAALPFLRHAGELDQLASDPSDAYGDFHAAFTQCRTATQLLESTGLFELNGHADQTGEIAQEDLIDVFQGVIWTYYFSVVTESAAEAEEHRRNKLGMVQAWKSAFQETKESLIEHGVPEKYFPLFEAKIREVYPDTGMLSVWQASDLLRNECKTQVAKYYMHVVESYFPWDRRARKRRSAP